MLLGSVTRKFISLMLVIMVILSFTGNTYAAKGGKNPEPVVTAPVIEIEQLSYDMMAGELIFNQIVAAFKPADQLIWTVEPSGSFLEFGAVSYNRKNTDATQSFSLTPSVGDVTTTFAITATDSLNPKLSDIVHITVNIIEEPVPNIPPTITGEYNNLTTDEDTALPITILASDSDGDELTYTASEIQNGELDVTTNSDGLFLFTPSVQTAAIGSFKLTVTDIHGASDTALVKIAITAVNDAPIANPDSVSGKVGELVTIDVLKNDYDVDGDALFIISVSGGTINGSTVSFTIEQNMDTITYTISDGELFSTSYITIIITEDELIYLALGDSIPYGTYYKSFWNYLFGGTDTNSYVEQFASYIGADLFLDESVSGDNAIDLYNDIHGHLTDEVQNADVITLSIGANDIMDAAPRISSGLDKYGINWIAADNGLVDFATYWPQIVDRIYELNPDVTLIVMTVYNPYRTTEKIYDQVNSYFEGVGGINEIIRTDDDRYKVADVYHAFNEHENKDSLTGFYSRFCDPHPNQLGQNLIYSIHTSVY